MAATKPNVIFVEGGPGAGMCLLIYCVFFHIILFR
jgi:hypothetical protein